MTWLFWAVVIVLAVWVNAAAIARKKELERKKKKLEEDLKSGKRSWISVGLYELGDW